MSDQSTILGKVMRGALTFDSATAFMQALVPFEGKRVEVTVREIPMTATEPRVDARLCKCGHEQSIHVYHSGQSESIYRRCRERCDCIAYEPAVACICGKGATASYEGELRDCPVHGEPAKAEPAWAEPGKLERVAREIATTYWERGASTGIGDVALVILQREFPTVPEATSPEPRAFNIELDPTLPPDTVLLVNPNTREVLRRIEGLAPSPEPVRVEQAEKELGLLRECMADEVETNLRISARIGIAKAIEDGKAYEDAEVELFDSLRERIASMEAELARVREELRIVMDASSISGAAEFYWSWNPVERAAWDALKARAAKEGEAPE